MREDSEHRWESLLSHGNRQQECMTRTLKSSERALRIGNRERPRPPGRVGNGERGTAATAATPRPSVRRPSVRPFPVSVVAVVIPTGCARRERRHAASLLGRREGKEESAAVLHGEILLPGKEDRVTSGT